MEDFKQTVSVATKTNRKTMVALAVATTLGLTGIVGSFSFLMSQLNVNSNTNISNQNIAVTPNPYDINRNGRVDVADTLLAVKQASGSGTADYNGDGREDIIDIIEIFIKKIYLSFPPSQPLHSCSNVSMSDAVCYADESSGHQLDVNSAISEALSKCESAISECTIEQDTENENNRQACEDADCAFASSLIENACTVQRCETFTIINGVAQGDCYYERGDITTNPDGSYSLDALNPDGGCDTGVIPRGPGSGANRDTYINCFAEGLYDQDNYECE